MSGAIAAAAIGAGSSLFGSLINYGFNRDQFKYQKQLNDLLMQREDTAVQRATADYQKAGLSPLNAVGNPAQAQSLNAGQAPQFDLNSVVQSALQAYQAKANVDLTQAQVKKTQAETNEIAESSGREWQKILDEQFNSDRNFYQQERALKLEREKFEDSKKVSSEQAKLIQFQYKQIESALKDSDWYNENVRQTKTDLELDALHLANVVSTMNIDRQDFEDLLQTIESLGDGIIPDSISALLLGSNVADKILGIKKDYGTKNDYGHYDPYSSLRSSAKAIYSIGKKMHLY